MPKITGPGRLPGTLSLSKFARAGAMRDFLEFYAFRDRYFHIDDFDGDAINLDYYALAAAGAAAAVFATNVQNGTGVVRGSTGTDDNAATSLVGPIIFRGDNNCGIWARLKLDAVTSCELEVGFVDAVPGSAGPAFSAVAPTAVAADAAVIHFDTDEASAALDRIHLLTVGSTANQDAKATSFGLDAVAATFLDVTLQIIGNDVVSTVSIGTTGQVTVSHNNGTSGNAAGHVEGGVSLAPWVYCRTRSTTPVLCDLDAIAVWSDRIA